jgi:hypothetical protein
MSAFRDILPTDEPPSESAGVPPATVFDRLLDALGTAPLATDGGRPEPPINETCAACGALLRRLSRTASGPDRLYEHVRCSDPDCATGGCLVRDRQSSDVVGRRGPALHPIETTHDPQVTP